MIHLGLRRVAGSHFRLVIYRKRVVLEELGIFTFLENGSKLARIDFERVKKWVAVGVNFDSSVSPIKEFFRI